MTDPVPEIAYPRLVEAAGRCPPEDVGGPWGYTEFFEAIRDPEHEEHDHMVMWAGGHFDPQVVDADRLTRDVANLAKRWSRTPTTRRNCEV